VLQTPEQKHAYSTARDRARRRLLPWAVADTYATRYATVGRNLYDEQEEAFAWRTETPINRGPERPAQLGEDRRRRDRVPQMPGQERHHLPAHLKVRHIPVQVDPVRALHIQHSMPVEQLAHRHRLRHRHRLPATSTFAQPQTRRSEAKPR